MAFILDPNSRLTQPIPNEKIVNRAQASGDAEQNAAVNRLAMEHILSADGSQLEKLPDELKVMIIERLDLISFAKFRECSQSWNQFGKDHLIWKSIARQIGCQITNESPIPDQVGVFIAELRKTVSNLPWRPLDIDHILSLGNLLTVEQINLLQNFLEAYNILAVWIRLGKAIRPNADIRNTLGVSAEYFQTSAGCIEKAKEFNLWIAANQGELGRLRTLNLSNLNLTFLPKEICDLTGLVFLDLRNNHINSLPAETGLMNALETLHLDRNQIASLPEEIGLPRNLRILTLTGNQIGSLPEGIRALSSLQILNLVDNPLRALPSALDQLVHLVNVALAPEQLGIISDEIYAGMPIWKSNLVNQKLSHRNAIESNPPALGEVIIPMEEIPEEQRVEQTVEQTDERADIAGLLGMGGVGVAAAIYFIGRHLFL